MIIAFTGQISSGKSTLTKALAAKTGWSRFSFGEYVGSCAQRIGLDSADRETLQDLGACLSKRPDLFVRGFLTWTGMPENMIIDGVRHLLVLNALKVQADRHLLKLVFVDTPFDIAEQRFEGDLRRVREHAVEAEIESLRALSQLVLSDSSANALEMVMAVV